MSAGWRWFLVSLAAWTAFAVLVTVWGNFEAVLVGRNPPLLLNFVRSLGEQYALGLLTPVLIYAARAFPPGARSLGATLGTYLATLIAVTAIGVPLLAFVGNTLLNQHFTMKSALEESLFTFLVYSVALTIIVAVSQVQLANERLARALRLEADLSKLRVEALQRQLHPHFIFNTLNAISGIMHTDVNAAEEMIAALADLLRTATDKSNRPMVPLREELSLLDRYALIMKMRYGDRLIVRISAEPQALEVPFPTFTLQPLVENAIVHGLEKTTAAVTVQVGCRVDVDTLRIDVSDDGAATDLSALQEGVGIGNTRARLAELYGARAQLSFAANGAQGMHLAVAIPTALPV